MGRRCLFRRYYLIALFLLGCHQPPIRAPHGRTVNGFKVAVALRLHNRDTGKPVPGMDGVVVEYADGSLNEWFANCMHQRRPIPESEVYDRWED